MPWPRATLFLVALETVVALVLESLVLREHVTRLAQPETNDPGLDTALR